MQVSTVPDPPVTHPPPTPPKTVPERKSEGTDDTPVHKNPYDEVLESPWHPLNNNITGTMYNSSTPVDKPPSSSSGGSYHSQWGADYGDEVDNSDGGCDDINGECGNVLLALGVVVVATGTVAIVVSECD
jgi:hypothetical protein